MKILVSYRSIPESPGWATGDMVVRALRDLGHEVHAYASVYMTPHWLESPTALVRDEYDLILFMECNDAARQYTELKDVRARKKACWLFDTSYYPDECEALVKLFGFDHIFLANPITLDHYLRSKGISNASYLPYGYDSRLHVRSFGPKTRDVVLVGSIRDDRIALVKNLESKGLKLELIGGVFREEYIDTLASARFVVNQNPDAGRGLLNMRHFEAQAAGSVLIEDWHDLGINMTAGMPCSAGVINYEDIDDIVDLCNDYRGCAEDVAWDTRDFFLARHSYHERCKIILQTLFPHEV